MNKNPNYKKGRRREIIQLMHICGSIPYMSITLLENGKNYMYHRAIKKMLDEGVIEIVKRNRIRQLVFKDYRKDSEVFTNYLPDIYYETYMAFGSNARTIACNFNKTDSERVIKVSETIIMMYACGISVMPDMKENLKRTPKLHISTKAFYNAREVKNTQAHIPKIINEKTSEEIKNEIITRMCGLIISEGGVYPIFNLRNHLMEWRPNAERKMQMHIERIVNAKYEPYMDERDYKCESIIILAKDNQTLSKMIDVSYEEDKNERPLTQLISTGEVYKVFYGITVDENGKKMLQILTTPGWKKLMIESLLLTDDGRTKQTELVTVACDGYDAVNKIYKLLFCIPDIAKLKLFAARACLDNTPSQYEIYCFTFQKKLVMSIVGKNAKIKTIELDKYYEFCMSLSEGREVN